MTEEPGGTRWSEIAGDSGEEYAERFAALARSGADVHGEARFCAALLPPGARVLDAGCGTGRVAVRLDELGFQVVGADVDESMLAVARRTAPQIAWHKADVSQLTARALDGACEFDLVVLAGNVVPLLAEGTLPRAVRSLAALLRPGGLMVAGFGLDSAHLPAGCPVTGFEEYDAAGAAAGLELRERYSTWDRAPFDADEGYAVSVHVSSSTGSAASPTTAERSR